MARRSLKNIHSLIKQAQQEMPINESFVSDLAATIEKMQTPRKPSQSYKPSSMLCVRNMFYQVAGQEPEESQASYMLVGMGESGSARHDHLQKYINSMIDFGMDCEYIEVEEYIKQQKLDHLQIVSKQGMETKLYHTELNISFLCDGIIKYKGKFYILEIKTEASFKFQKRLGVAVEHKPQASTYSLAFGIDDVLFLYENRDTCDKKAYILNVTEDMKFEIIDKIETCENSLKTLKPPKADHSDMNCKYCNYKGRCRADG